MPAPLPPAPHVARYFVRIDAELERLPDTGEREKLLHGQIRVWERHYAEHIRKAARNEPSSPEVTAWDYEETISGLARRLERVAS